jgi:hypothetical protein
MHSQRQLRIPPRIPFRGMSAAETLCTSVHLAARALGPGPAHGAGADGLVVLAPLAGLRPCCGTCVSMPKTTPVRSAFGAMVSSTRLLSFFASQRVFSSGRVARQPLQRTVRAQR